MNYTKRHEGIEEIVFEAIEEIAEEFDLDVPFYPRVSSLNRFVEFKESGLPSYFKGDFENLRKEWDAVFIERPCSIILSSRGINSAYGEEATHFVHHVNSRIKKRKGRQDIGYIQCLSEMLGFFGSLVLGEDRKNQYSEWPDMYSERKEFKDFAKRLRMAYPTLIFLIDHVIHQQGYGLGERLFFAYQNANISKKEIRGLFKNDFEEKNSAKNTFFKLRERLDWPVKA